MTQYSWSYSCNPDTGDAGPLTRVALSASRMFLGNLNPKTDGVVYWTADTPANILYPGTPPGFSANPLNGLLEPTTPGGGVVRIAAGVGIVLGFLFASDDNEDFDIDGDPGESNATDLIVLRRNDLASVAQSARLERKKAGAPSSTAVVQQDADVWEIPIAQVHLDVNGDLSSITDMRQPALPGGALVKLWESVGDGTFSTVTFDSIPPLFRQLRIVVKARSTAAVSVAGLNIRLNNDAGANYSHIRISSDGSSITTSSGSSLTSFSAGNVPGSNVTAGYASVTTIDIPDYRDSVFNKILFAKQLYRTQTPDTFTITSDGTYVSTNPVSRVDVILANGNYVTGSRVTLYGVV